MKCLRCNRQLKKPTASGFGAVCARKVGRESGTQAAKIRIEVLHKSPTRRSYLVFTSPRRTVRIYQNPTTGKTADCECRPFEVCEHIAAVISFETANFPKNEVNQNV